VKRAVVTYGKDVIALILIAILSLVVAAFILSNQRLTLPGWVPFVGKSFYTLNGEFSTAQAVTPGQGQTVNIAGVKVGEISKVELKDGVANVQMKLEPKYGTVYPNATMLLRPKTGLKDMVVQLDPGTKAGGKPLKSGGTIPVSQTLPDVNLDEVLSAVDGDTRAYLQLLIQGGGKGLKGQGANLRRDFKRFDPTARDIAKITRLLQKRRANIRRSVHNFKELSTALAGKDKDLARLVDSSDAVFAALANQDSSLRQTIAELPGALNATRTGLTKVGTFARRLGPAAQALRPGARALAPTLRQLRPALVEGTPIIRDQIRPFARAALPTLQQLPSVAKNLNASTNDLVTSTKVVNYLLNELAYNPPGKGVTNEGYMFWLAWANHNANTVFANQDAQGTIRRGLLLASCGTIQVLSGLAAASPQIKNLLSQVGPATCPTSGSPSGAP
jgi:phospholipid/cholesterol/gamma-HCH transport system substrate-binding protein